MSRVINASVYLDNIPENGLGSWKAHRMSVGLRFAMHLSGETTVWIRHDQLLELAAMCSEALASEHFADDAQLELPFDKESA